MPFKSFKDESRANWGETLEPGQFLSDERLQLGAILRIADATEAMAKNWRQLVAERDEAVASRDRALAREDKLDRRVAALRGVITRMKRGSRS